MSGGGRPGGGARGGLVRGIALAVAHLLIVSSLGAKLLHDRSHRPRVWVETTPFDPELPIRGRYVSLRLQVDAPDVAPPAEDKHDWLWRPVTLAVARDHLVARSDSGMTGRGRPSVTFLKSDDRWVPTLREPVAFFIPEHVEDPSRLAGRAHRRPRR